MVKYTQFIQVVHRTEQEALKVQVRRTFNRYDERRLEGKVKNSLPGLLSKEEVTKLLTQIMPEMTADTDRLFTDWDKDQDQKINIEETISMFLSIALNYL